MRIEGRDYRTIWLDDDGRCVHVIDQTALPHRLATSASPTRLAPLPTWSCAARR